MYPYYSFTGLYPEITIPRSCVVPIEQNDWAAMQPHGFLVKDMTESKCVAELIRRYQELAERKP